MHGSLCVTLNRFAALQELDEDEEMSVGTITPGLTVGDSITVKPKYQKKTEGRKVNSLEVDTVHENSDLNELTITIGSGASENVISEEFAPQVKVRGRSAPRHADCWYHVQPR